MLVETKTIGGIYTVSKLLGHSRVAVTEMYLHCSQDQLEQAMLADPLGRVYSVMGEWKKSTVAHSGNAIRRERYTASVRGYSDGWLNCISCTSDF